ncbi:heme biosynthesis HemY N-terminal domain-containing protein [Glaciimonas immobilis]|uniref:HemY protein n=1 Tax=Glaciimonas immobilis TaxID=728004 RepID=A0A840RQ04_9BURK|nr:heme biosynthesis HemY N-terminal domain-containing protein [Glaciimonas immobilis]KAF3998085.1 heme biosynthesis protein HemY [Glaciimonas immobilis]MBB5199222.1 HemY protein [Glaciimonas immobilis]
MRFFLWIISLLATAIGLAVLARYNVGNVTLFYLSERIDLSLNFVLLLLALLFLAFYILVRAIRTTQKLPGRVISYRRQKREERSNKALRESLKSLFEGRFGQAEKSATRAAELNDNLGVAALIAARAAHRMGQFDRRDIWLSSIEDKEAMKTARLMTTLNLLVDEHKPQAALVTVNELNASGIRHIQALRLALKAHQQAKNWSEVLRLVKTLDKHDALNPILSGRLREMAYESLLADASHDAESLQRLWQTIPAEDRLKPSLVIRAARAFNQREMQDDARNMVEKTLSVDWDVRLMRVYRDSVAAEGTPALRSQIERCEAWSVNAPQDPELALTLGTFCLRQKLWGKAQRHLQQALSNAIEPRTVREAHLKLAQLHESLEQPEKAADHYRQCALATMM